MDKQRIESALARIGKAADRIEHAARQAGNGSQAQAKYADLRRETEAALADLDRVIDGLQS